MLIVTNYNSFNWIWYLYKKINFGGGYLRLTSSCVECSFIILVKLSAENDTKPELNSNKQNKHRVAGVGSVVQ